MNFPVPWRCLLPIEAVDYCVYNNSAVLRDLSDRTGALIDVSGERDTPKRLSDRIVTMSGQAEQKEGACKGIVERLRKLRDLHDPEELGFFVIIVPATSVPVIVGAKGVTIQEVLANSGADLSIGKENIMGMPDTPIGLEGTAKQVVAATVAIHKVVQEMADRGRLMPSDFKYRPEKAAQQLASGAGLGIPQVALPPAGHDPYGGMDPTQNFRTKVKLVIDTMTAGWLIGKGGRTIREMQENSGAFLHILREEEAATVLPRPGDRLLEVCGRYERKLEGIQVVMRTADSMPNGQGPKETLMMLPTLLTVPWALQEVGDAYGCCVEAEKSSTADESIVTIAGNISNRIQAVQAFLTRLDKAHMDGTVVALSVDGEYIGRDGRPRKELRDAGVEWTPPEIPKPQPRPLPPPMSERPVPAAVQAPAAAPVSITPTPKFDRPSVTAPRLASDWMVGPQARMPPPSGPVQAESPPGSAQAAELRPAAAPSSTLGREDVGFREARQPEVLQQEPLRGQPAEPQRPPMPETSRPWEQTAPAGGRQDVGFREAQQSEPQRRLQAEAQRPLAPEASGSRWETVPPREESEAGQEVARLPSPPPLQEPQSPRQQLPVVAGLQPPAGTAMESLMTGASLEAGKEVEAELVRTAINPTAASQMHLLLPEALLFDSLIPSGHLKDVANRCQVTIDLGDEQPHAQRLVTLTGAVAGTAAAVYWLQLGLARAIGALGE